MHGPMNIKQQYYCYDEQYCTPADNSFVNRRSVSAINEHQYEDWIQSEKDSISNVTHKVIQI